MYNGAFLMGTGCDALDHAHSAAAGFDKPVIHDNADGVPLRLHWCMDAVVACTDGI